MPNIKNNITYNDKDYIIDNDNDIIKLPSLFYGKKEELPSKWRAKVKGKWSNLIIIKNYNLINFIEFIKWLSNYLGIYIKYDEIKELVYNTYKKIIYDKKLLRNIFEDSSFKNAWCIVTKIKTIQLSKINDIFDKLSNTYISDTLDTIFENDYLYPNDITMKIISDIFNISILLIHRSQYGKTTINITRRDLDDLLISSTFISANKNMDERPLFIFNKIDEKDTNYSSYYPVVENTENIDLNSIFIKYKYVSDNIKKLIEMHKKI